MHRATDTRSRQSGIALVETVIIAPVLLFLILLTAEVTNAFVDHNTLTKSARNASRYLAGNALLGTTGTVVLDGTLIDEARNLVVYGNVAGAGNPILPGLAVGDVAIVYLGADNVQITVSYSYTGLLGGTLPALGFGPDPGLNMTLQATVAMRAL